MNQRQNHRTGLSLVEVTLALGVASVSLAAIFGLLPLALQTNHNVTEETLATDILATVSADLHATPAMPKSSATSPRFAIEIPSPPFGNTTTSTLFFDRNGQITTSGDRTSWCRLTIRFLPNNTSRGATLVHLTVSWPAQALPSNLTGSVETLLGLDRN